MSAVLDSLPALVHRTRDEPEPAPSEPTGHRLVRPEELGSIAAANTKLAANETAQASIDQQYIEARFAEPTAATHAKRAKLAADADKLKAEHPTLRGVARAAHLDALERATKRAAVEYVTAARIFGECAAKYVALAGLRDELLGTQHFDQMGLWAMVGTALAPEPQHRPRGCTVVPDRFQRACIWNTESALHHEQVRSFKSKFVAELQTVSNGARFPFN